MYAEERQQAMAELVTTRGRLSVTDIATEFEVTTETVRRDLSALERMGLVRRVHGGAVPTTSLTAIESGLGERDSANADQKERIARAALDLLPPAGSTVLVDAGSTTQRLAGLLPRDHRLVVVTHAVPVAARLAGMPQIELHLLPGRVRPTTQAAVGAETVAALADLRADMAFIGTNGISVRHGLSTPDSEEAATKRAMVAGAQQVVVLADASKVGREATIRFSRLDEVDVLVTDGALDDGRPRGPGRGRPGGPGRMILTLTANPSHDRTVALAAPLERGAVMRASSVTSQAGGKGVNISRASVAAGVPSLAVLPAPPDDPFVLELLSTGIDCRPVDHPGDLRVNITITEPDGTTTKLNSPGPTMTPATMTALSEALHRRAEKGSWVVLAGSLPPGTPDHWYADLVATLADSGASVAIDTSDAPLRALVDQLDVAAPHLMKPNGHELASFTGHDPATLESDPLVAARAAATLVDAGVEAVLATLGAHGAVLVTADGAWHASPPPIDVVSTVGAGDSSLFGYLLGAIEDRPPAHRLALAVAYGSAAAGLPGTTIPHPSQVTPELVSVRDLDLTQGG